MIAACSGDSNLIYVIDFSLNKFNLMIQMNIALISNILFIFNQREKVILMNPR